jgi:hypothetical protein
MRVRPFFRREMIDGMPRRITFLCATVQQSEPDLHLVDGECWLGPIKLGDRFTATMDAEGGAEEHCDLVVVALSREDDLDLDPGLAGTLALVGSIPLSGLSGRLFAGEMWAE